MICTIRANRMQYARSPYAELSFGVCSRCKAKHCGMRLMCYYASDHAEDTDELFANTIYGLTSCSYDGNTPRRNNVTGDILFISSSCCFFRLSCRSINCFGDLTLLHLHCLFHCRSVYTLRFLTLMNRHRL